jgi:hypothetical protein
MMQRISLTVSDFQYTPNLTNPVQLSPVLSYTVPLKTVLFLDPTRPIVGNIMAKFEKTLATADIGAGGVVTITLPLRVSEVPEGVKNVVGIYDPTGSAPQIAYGEIDATDPSRKKVKFTFSSPEAGKLLRVFYSVDNVYFDLAVIAPSTSETITRVFLEGKLGYINALDPFDVRQSARLKVSRIIPALEDFQLQFRVKSDQIISFERPESFIEIPVILMDEASAEQLYRSKGGYGVREALKQYFKTL